MATLIQSKQIEGVVTASVIQGDFQASGDISASIISASQIVGVKYGDIEGTPNFVGGSGITITQVGDTYTFTNTGGSGDVGDGVSDSASILQINAYTASNDLTIQRFEETTSSLQTQITSLSSSLSNIERGTTDFSELTGVPQGIVSSSIQILGGSDVVSGSVLRTLDGTGVLSGSKTDISHLNEFTTSIQSQVDELILSSSTFITSETDSQTLTIVGDQLTISDGNTITIPTGSSGGVSSWNELTDIPSGLVSGSYVESLPSGLVSSSEQVLGGSGILSGSHTDITSLNDYTSSTDSRLTSIETTTASLQSQIDGIVAGQTPEGTISSSAQITALGFISESVGGTSDFTQLTNVPSGLVSGSTQITDGSSIVSGSVLRTLDGTDVLSGSLIPGTNITIDSSSGDYVISSTTSESGDITFDGNRVISNDKLGDLFTDSVNPGTSGSIQDFLNAVFYPNSAPTITTTNQTISEYTPNGSTIVTLSGTDPEGQSLTWGVADSYTDGLVSVASNGVMTLSSLPTSASFNTSAVGGGFGHLVTVTATDDFGTVTPKDIYIIVTPNEAPKFRETSVSGNIITSVNVNLNENSANNTLVKRVFFTDAESDTITITTSSIDNEHFDVDIQSTYVDIRQNTGSLDYEQQTSYTFNIFASDEHYESGDDLDSITTLPITINVVDNLVPTINNQTLSSINENSSNGASVDSISAADNESDTITFTNFTLSGLKLDGVDVTQGTYGGTSQLTDPHENPFQMDSSGNVTRKNGVFLNSDLIDEYQYTVQVRDSYNGTSSPATITIPIDDDTPATLSDNFSFGYIIESATSGDVIRINTNGFTGTQADLNSNQSGTWSSSNSTILIDTNGSLSLGVDLNGSVTQSGDVISTTITFTNTFGTTTTQGVTTLVSENQAPTATFTNQSSIFNSNQAITNTNLVSVSITDTEGDTPYNLTLGGTDASKLNAVPQNADSSSWELQASENLIGGTYTYDVTVTDNFGKSTTYSDRTITIAQADTGTLGGDTTSYIIESAESGDSLRDASGYNQGNTSQLSVSYTNYGSPVVQSYTSSNPAFNIDTNGNITLAVDISGSATGSGDTISSDISFVDQYGNVGSGTLTVNVFENQAPTAIFSENSSFFNTNQATGSVSLVDVTISDTEGDTPYGLTLGGTNGSSFTAVPQNENSSSWEIQPSADLSAGTYSYDVTVTDNFSKTRTYSRTLTITLADSGTLSTNGTLYIIESATTGPIYINSNGRSGTSAVTSVSYSPNYGSQLAKDFTSSNPLIGINSVTGVLSVGDPINGSGNLNGSTIESTITWVDQYGNNGSDTISVNVTKNNAPTVFSTQTFNTNTNQATGSSEIVRLNLSDVEADSIPSTGLSWSGYNSTYFTPSNTTGVMKLLVNSTSIPAGEYGYTASIQDIHGFDTTVHSGSVTIAQADNGTLVGDTSIYIIESALRNDLFRDASGYNNGNAAQVSVSYSPNYGSQTVGTFTSSNPTIVIDGSGNLTLGVDISGSETGSGDTFTSTITFTDQYGNSDTGTVTATVFANNAPSANFTANSLNSDEAIDGADIGSVTVSDTEGNTPFTVTLGGTDGSKFRVVGSTSPFEIQPTESLTGGTYSIDITVTDSVGKSATLTNETIVVEQVIAGSNVYVYTLPIDGSYSNVTGITSNGSGTPPEPTIATTYGFFTSVVDSDTLGDAAITVQYGTPYTATLRGTASGNNLDTILDDLGALTIGGSPASERIFVFVPAGSEMSGVPTSLSTADAGAGSTSGEYIVYVSPDGTFQGTSSGLDNDIKSANIHKLTLDTAVDGYTEWYVIGTEDKFNNSNAYVRMVPSSGSIPS